MMVVCCNSIGGEVDVPEDTNRAATVRERTVQASYLSAVRLLTRAALNAYRS